MALVYEAIQKSLHRKVALKVLSPALVADQDFCQRFLEEGKTVARLSHQNIVTIYDIGHHDMNYFMSMEFINGGNLRTRIESGMDEREVVQVARQIARALGYAHDHGFLHRDVKPHNILFREDGVAVLSDFGIAKNLSENSELTRTGKSLGSPLYMSPEQIRNESLDVRSDLYSLGVVIYQMLTGYAPYLASTAESTTRMHLSCPVPDLPQELSKFQPLIRRLLAKRRNNRFLNAWELIESLDGIANGAGVNYDAPSATSQIKKQQIEKTIAMDVEQVAVTETHFEPDHRGDSEITQEMDDSAVAEALRNPEESKIFATRDDDVRGLASTTQAQTTKTGKLRSEVTQSRKSSLKIGLLAALILAGVLIYPQLSKHFGESSENVETAGDEVASSSNEIADLPISQPKDVQIAFGKGAVFNQQSQKEQPQIAALDPTPVTEPIPSASVVDEQPAPEPVSATDEAVITVAAAPVILQEKPVSQPKVAVVSTLEPEAPVVAAKPVAESLDPPTATIAALAEEPTIDISPPPTVIAFESLQDPGLVKVNGEFWISHELENILRRSGQRIFRLGDGSLSISLEQNQLFPPNEDYFISGASEQLDQLSYLLRNYSGFTVNVSASSSGFGEQQILDLGQLRAQRVAEYLRLQMNDPGRLILGESASGSNVDGGSVEFRLIPVPIL